MTPFLRRVMERRLEEQMQAAVYEEEARRCEGCGQKFRNLQNPMCRPCERKASIGYGCPDTSRVGIQDTP